MTSGSSRAFRRWCAATCLLVASWSLPGSVEARVSPMEIVKQQLRKPNFLIMVESPESMQGLPGENPARYNEVGADCQNGDRYCRLYGQPNRCEFSGMGGQGYKFDTVSVGTASQTQTQSQTLITSTISLTQTGTSMLSANMSAWITSTVAGASGIVSETATGTVITVQSSTGTGTSISTATQTVSQTETHSTSSTASNSQTTTQSTSGTASNTQSATQSTSATASNTQSATQSTSATASNTQTATQSGSSSGSSTQTATQPSSSSQTTTQTATQSTSGTASNTQSATQSTSGSGSNTQTATQSSSSTGSSSQTATQSGSSSGSNTQTATQSGSSSGSNTRTATQSGSGSGSNTQTATQSGSGSGSNTQTATQSSSGSGSNTRTATRSTSGTASNTQTATQSGSGSGSNTRTATQSSSSSGSSSRTASWTTTGSASSSASNTQSYTASKTGATTSYVSADKIGTDTSIRGYWGLDEAPATGESYPDTSGNNNDGTATGPPLPTAGVLTGTSTVVTTGASFANTTVTYNITWTGTSTNTLTSTGTNFVRVLMSKPIVGSVSIAVWVKTTDFNPRQNLVAFTPGGDDAGGGLRLFSNRNNILMDNNTRLITNDWTPTRGVTAPNSLYTTSYYGLIVGTISGTTWTLYQFHDPKYCTGTDSKVAVATVTDATFSTGTEWCFGSSCAGAAHEFGFKGGLDEVRIWDRALSTSGANGNELQNLCNCNAVKCPAPTGTMTTTNTETKTPTSTSSATSSRTASSSSSSMSSSSSTYINTSSSSSSGSSTYTNTGSSSSTSSSTYSNTGSSSSSVSSTMTNTASATSSGSSTYSNTSSSSSSGSSTFSNTASGSASVSSTMTNTASATSSGSSTYSNTSSSSSSGSSTLSNSSSSSATSSSTMTKTASASSSGSSTYSNTSSASSTSSVTYTNTANQSSSSTVTMTKTASESSSGTSTYSSTATSSVSLSASSTSTGSSSGSSSGTSSGTATSTTSWSSTMTGAATSSGSTSATGTNSATQSGVTSTNTAIVTGNSSASVTLTETGSGPLITSDTDLTSNTSSYTGTQTLTATGTAASTLQSVPDTSDCTPASCTWASGVSSSYCYLNSSVQCYSNDDCYNLAKGDFCRYVSTDDGSGRFRNDFCASGATKTCRYQATTPCNSDSQCDSGKGDYCVFGKPANMCQRSGLWCTDDGMGCDSSSGDACVPATSRMMMVKNAVRRVVLEHAYDDTAVVKIGQMHTYQAGNGSTDNLFPYVKLNTTSTGTSFLTSTRVDTKFLPRSELLKGVNVSGKACFSSSTGPSSTCTIDYSGGGASVNTPTVTYSLQSSGNDSRYAVPSGNGKTYYRQDAPWSSCGWMCYFAGAGPGGGEGIYEGSYYTFSYIFGTPVVGTPSDPAGTGSLYAPKYSTSYLGKSYGSAGNYWYLMDAERTEFVNENKYGAREFSGLSGAGAGLPWSQGYVPTGDEYPLPLTGARGDPTSTSLTCGAANGAQWDHNVVPMVNDTSFGGNSSLKPTQKALMNAARLDKASYGGFYATGNLEPIACALKNDGQNDKYHSIDNYMSIVQSSDGVANGGTSPCWENHVLMVVDGLPRGPGDVAVGGVDCSAAACTYDPVANPNLNGCNCPAVSKARALAANGVNVHVIAATTDLTGRNTYAAATLNNVARAGSTSPSFINIPRYAASEDELYYWLNYEMKEALRVTAATTPASAASGSQSLSGVTAGNMLFQTTVELPEWRGSLVGFGIGIATATTTTTATASVYTTQLAWDATTVNAFAVHGSALSDDEQKLWKQRHVYFSNATGAVHQITVTDDEKVDGSSKTALGALGMGGNPDETERIVLWMLGKIDASDTVYHRPLNPAVMGSVVNSMPIDVGSPGTSLLPGGNRFYWDHVNRSELVYLGADDGMLHAFYASNGKEAFAFIPADMVPMIAKIYAQGGQRYSPIDHIYGLAGSPKVKNLCVANCKVAANLTCSDDQIGQYDSGCPDWRTILVMSEGPGGNHPFALDITEPVESGAPTLKDASLLWHVGYKNASGISASDLGETDSVPAFAFHRTTNMNDNRVLMASGYPFTGSSTTTKLIDAMVWDGSTPSVAGPGATISGSGGCESSTGQEFAVVADVAVARDNFHNGTSPTDQNLLAAYVADTWGKVHQYAPSYGPALDKGGAPISLGCSQPLHFSPAVVQLNRNNSNDPDNSVYLGQVTNSILDPNTVGSSFPASMLVVAKLTSIGSAPPALEQTFGSSGLIKLVADDTLTDANRLCGVTTVGKTSAASTCGSGGSWLPATARPTGTPVAVVRTDGTGFQLFTTWYDPPKANWDNCPESSTNGNSYVTLHEFLSNGTWAQIAGREYPNQYVTGVQFVGTTIFITFGTNATTPDPTTDSFGQNFQSITPQSLSALSGDRFIRTAWSERIDAE